MDNGLGAIVDALLELTACEERDERRDEEQAL